MLKCLRECVKRGNPDPVKFACMVADSRDSVHIQVASDLISVSLEGGVHNNGIAFCLPFADQLQQSRLQADAQPCSIQLKVGLAPCRSRIAQTCLETAILWPYQLPDYGLCSRCKPFSVKYPSAVTKLYTNILCSLTSCNLQSVPKLPSNAGGL